MLKRLLAFLFGKFTWTAPPWLKRWSRWGATISIPILNDTKNEPQEQLVVALSSPSTGSIVAEEMSE
jgi:hypothetical protein